MWIQWWFLESTFWKKGSQSLSNRSRRLKDQNHEIFLEYPWQSKNKTIPIWFEFEKVMDGFTVQTWWNSRSSLLHDYISECSIRSLFHVYSLLLQLSDLESNNDNRMLLAHRDQIICCRKSCRREELDRSVGSHNFLQVFYHVCCRGIRNKWSTNKSVAIFKILKKILKKCKFWDPNWNGLLLIQINIE